jgi:1-phosphatidylinositol phosphodiesterase
MTATASGRDASIRTAPQPAQRWMSLVDDDLTLSEFNIPGTHDSGTYQLTGHWLKTQIWSIEQQLEHGIRWLDIRCKQYQGGLGIYHQSDFVNLTFDQLMAICTAFLTRNPSECIIMMMSHEEVAANVYDETFDRIAQAVILGTWGSWFHLGPIRPTLGSVRGKVVLVRRFASTVSMGIDFTAWLSPFPGRTLDFPQGQDHVWIQDVFWNDGAPPASLDRKAGYIADHARLAREGASNDWYINLCSSTGVTTPWQFATGLFNESHYWGMNDRLTDLVYRLGGRVGTIVLDFCDFPEGAAIRCLLPAQAANLFDWQPEQRVTFQKSIIRTTYAPCLVASPAPPIKLAFHQTEGFNGFVNWFTITSDNVSGPYRFTKDQFLTTKGPKPGQTGNVGLSGRPAVVHQPEVGGRYLLIHEGYGNEGYVYVSEGRAVAGGNVEFTADRPLDSFNLTPYKTSGTPAVVVDGRTVWIVTRERGDQPVLMIGAIDTDESGVDHVRLQVPIVNARCSSAPAAIMFQGKLHVIHEEAGQTGWLRMCVYDPATKTWSNDNLIGGSFAPFQTSGSPAAIVVTGDDGEDDLLVFSEARGEQGTLMMTSFDGVEWLPQEVVRDVNGARIETRFAPGLLIADGLLYCMREKRSDLGNIYLSVAELP